jgi:large subunit ribosomal protein L15
MKIHELKSFKKRVQRIGRSGKRGSYSGRGVKGQKSRSGRRLRPAERDLILRLPKQRGFANLPKDDKPIAFNLAELSLELKSFVQGKNALQLDRNALKVAGLLRKGYDGEVKVLGGGEISFPLAIDGSKGIKVSASARAKIEKAGGKVTN